MNGHHCNWRCYPGYHIEEYEHMAPSETSEREFFQGEAHPPRQSLHPSTQAILRYFDYAHLPQHLAGVSEPFCTLAWTMAEHLSGPELTAGLRKLLEAKDCMVRAALQASDPRGPREK